MVIVTNILRMPFSINQKKLEQVIFADFLHPQAKKLAERLSELTKLERLFFSDNGSTAV